MQLKRSKLSLLIAATLFAGGASTALAQRGLRPGGRIIIPDSSIPKPGDEAKRAHTNIQFVDPAILTGVTLQAFGPPAAGTLYETPASLACIYGLQPQTGSSGCNPNVVTANPTGGAKALAVVDVYDDPNAFTDLQNFSTQFGVTAITSSSFKVVYAPFGGTTPGSCVGPATSAPTPITDPTGGWEEEESLDIEYAHAMAPAATLYLVEAQSQEKPDLWCAVSTASALVNAAGGGEVSMSFSLFESTVEADLKATAADEAAADAVFTTPNVVYFAATGDVPGVSYPSASPNVIAVGGTTLSRNATGSFTSENAWQVAAGGPSAFEKLPSYQDGIAGIVGAYRGTPDIAADANPYTGVWVLDTFVGSETACLISPYYYYFCPGWQPGVGGTSLATPLWAGIANAKKYSAATSSAALASYLYANVKWNQTNNQGSCGDYMEYFATNSWNFCTGLGSPSNYSAPESFIPTYLSATCGPAGFVYGGNYTCNVSVSSPAGSPTGAITYTFDGGTPVSLPLGNGSAQFSLILPNAGAHTVLISYAQQGNFAASGPNTQGFTVGQAITAVSLTPSNYYPSVGSPLTLSVSVTSYSAPPPTAGAVTFYDHGVAVSTIILNALGQGSLTFPSIPAGSHSFEAQFLGLAPDYAAAGSNYLTILAH